MTKSPALFSSFCYAQGLAFLTTLTCPKRVKVLNHEVEHGRGISKGSVQQIFTPRQMQAEL